MATAKDLYQSGRLDDAIDLLGRELRDRPADRSRRTFLFELLSFAGEYERAEKQLDVLARDDRDAEMISWLYKGALLAQRSRSEMFGGGGLPASDVEPLPVSGTLNGEPFEQLEDADPRIGARLEVMSTGGYVWIPLSQLESVKVEPPERLRDLMWARAWVKAGPELDDKDLGEVLLPAMTPLSWQHADGDVRLGRVTDWDEADDGTVVPVGQKLLLVDGEPFPFLEVRELVIESPTGATA